VTIVLETVSLKTDRHCPCNTVYYISIHMMGKVHKV